MGSKNFSYLALKRHSTYLTRAAPTSITYWLQQLIEGSLLGLAQAATENGQ